MLLLICLILLVIFNKNRSNKTILYLSWIIITYIIFELLQKKK